MPEDTSYGWEAVAKEFMAVRSATGCAIVQRWAESLPRGGRILDIGAGSGKPLTAILVEDDFDIFAIDASPTLAAAFQQNFPKAKIACEPVETSTFFNETFDGVLAIGLIFLLTAPVQRDVIDKIAHSLKPGGSLLFSSPRQECTWNDILTGRRSLSLGIDEYQRTLTSVGLTLTNQYVDEGENHYYEAQKH